MLSDESLTSQGRYTGSKFNYQAADLPGKHGAVEEEEEKQDSQMAMQFLDIRDPHKILGSRPFLEIGRREINAFDTESLFIETDICTNLR